MLHLRVNYIRQKKRRKKMAPLDRNFVTQVALIIVLIGLSMLSCVAQTEATIACKSDDTGIACRYDCPAKVIQHYDNCTSEEVVPVLDVVEGKCCPGYFKTKNNKCQVCPDGRFMPDVNNCSECLLCTDCDTANVANNTLEFRCNLTTNAGCKLTVDPTPCAHPDCPWITSSSAAPTTSTQVPTSEAVSVNTPRDPQESTCKSEQTSLEIAFYVIVGPFILSLVVNVLLIRKLFIRKMIIKQRTDRRQGDGDNKEVDDPDKPGGTDQTDDENDRTRKEVANSVAYRKRRTVCDKCGQVIGQEDATVKNGDNKEVDDPARSDGPVETDRLTEA